jgi:hypothetical protein
MKANVQALSASYPPLEFFFAHYDGDAGRSAYKHEPWYQSKVRRCGCSSH